MPERGTAEERLERILYLLPAAARAGGVPLEELAGRLDVDVRTLLTDVETITERSFYHPPGGSADDLQISLTPSHIQVWTTGSFRRPPKLSLREALALVIGLRMAALERESGGSGDGGDAPPLFRRLEEVLAVRSAETIEQLLMAPDLDLDAGDPRRVLLDAAERRCRCRILYLKPDASEPEERTLDPYVIAYGEGQWYAIGHSPDAGCCWPCSRCRCPSRA